MNQRNIGTIYEHAVCIALEQHGYQIIEKNFRCKTGEIDLIAKDGAYLVFIEVKYRKDKKRGWPQEAVGPRKQRTISRVADYFIFTHPKYRGTPIRFDVAAVLGNRWKLLKNAFEYQGGSRWN